MDGIAKRFKTTPYRHQLNNFNRFGRREFAAHLDEMGTGKSWVVINSAADLFFSGDLDSILILAPNGVHSNWVIKEIPKHMPDTIRVVSAEWKSSGGKKTKFQLDGLFEISSDRILRILSMNHEALQTKKGMDFAEHFCKSTGRLMIVVDESDGFKNPSAVRTKNLMKLKKYSSYRRIMSGTPVSNSPFDVFSQFSFLDSEILMTKSYFSFKNEYAQMADSSSPEMYAIAKKLGGGRLPQIVAKDKSGRPIYRNLDKLNKLISPHSSRVLKKDCLDLPEKVYKSIYFDMTKEQRALYEKVKNEMRLEYDGELTTFSALTILQKLSQITSGYYLFPGEEEPIRIPGENNPRLDACLGRVISALSGGESIIIWCRYRAEIADVCKSLKEKGISFVEYHGGINSEERKLAIDKFESGDSRVFVGNQQAGGTGITLVKATTVIYYSNNFSLRDRLQSEDRAHRIGQTRTVTYFDLIARDTIDEKIVRALENKQEISTQVIDFLR